MSSIISATTRSRAATSDRFFAAADELLLRAREEEARGADDLALEYSYRAALRVAGAVCAESPVLRRRKRLPSSAWEKLALTGEFGEAWARRFSAFSSLRARVASGIADAPPSDVVRGFMDAVEEFFAAAQPGSTLVA
ncbi:SAV_6107 family HEPN domain-containing protein [Corynebacterium timonense]|uniref:SAV-6107-like HEPN domain-containing protein n=1 Tax=Corynebacterium timonense TaxID=441500 RepID=A0A1H1MK86_9CORY|nr:SAV_6107 family HEPN domain-containing protein [Corynebacterium timonense]SDR87168.1 hypothetical protein SAMN04488539_0546 [Corynebacterium timonense]